MIRAMLTAFPESAELYGAADQYMLGDALLVKPVTRPMSGGGAETDVILPRGGWYDLFTETCYEGGTVLTMETPLDRFPMLVRAGSVLPLSAGGCSTAELKGPADELLVFAGADGAFTLYDDAGDGMEYLQGDYLEIPLRWEDESRTLFAGKAKGSRPAGACLRVRLVRPDGSSAVRTLNYDGEPVALSF